MALIIQRTIDKISGICRKLQRNRNHHNVEILEGTWM